MIFLIIHVIKKVQTHQSSSKRIMHYLQYLFQTNELNAGFCNTSDMHSCTFAYLINSGEVAVTVALSRFVHRLAIYLSHVTGSKLFLIRKYSRVCCVHACRLQRLQSGEAIRLVSFFFLFLTHGARPY